MGIRKILKLLLGGLVVSSSCAEKQPTPRTLPPHRPAPTGAAKHYHEAFRHLQQFSAKELDLLGKASTVPLDARARALLRKGVPAVEAFLRGAAEEACDWQMDLSLEGYDAWSEDVFMPSQRLHQLACLDARQALEHGKQRQALEVLAALLRFSRHLDGASFMLFKLVRIELENNVLDTAAAHLPEMTPEIREALDRCLQAHPSSVRVAEAIPTEKEYYLRYARPKVAQQSFEESMKSMGFMARKEELGLLRKLSGGTPDGLLRLADELPPYYPELNRLLVSPWESAQPALAEISKKHATSNPMIASFARTLEGIRYAEARAAVRLVMLKAALSILDGGPEKLKEFNDPHGDGPFAYLETKGGFELRSRLSREGGLPAVLQVGR